MKPIIRIATVRDAHHIAQVHTQSWKETYRGIISDSYLDTLDIDEKTKWWENAIAQSALIHVARTDKTIGFAIGGKGRKKNKLYEGELYAFYLLKEYHGKGIGKMLFESVIDQLILQSINSMLVWVLKDNPSKGFYIKQGGKLLDEKEIEIGGQKVIEEAYGWRNILQQGHISSSR